MTDTAVPPDRLAGPVSAVIPCFRCAATIDRAVESVARQSVLPTELILVDDASGDDTLPALHRLQHHFPSGWIKVIAQNSNCGAGAARNAGWDAAQSEYIAFLDADDAWYPRKLEIQLNAMLAHPVAALSGHRATLGPTHADPEFSGNVPIEKITFRQLLFANRFVTPSVMLKRDLPFRFRAGQRHMEDHLLWMQIAASGALVLRLEAQLAVTFKPAYGASGLSNDLWLMEKSEYSNYRHLAETGVISHFSAIVMCAYSTLKFLKRMVVVAARAMHVTRTS